MLVKCLICLLIGVILLIASVGLIAWQMFQIRTEGTLYLKNAWGTVSILREIDTGIPHI